MRRVSLQLLCVLVAGMLGACASRPPRLAPAWAAIGHSVQRRPIEARTLGDGPLRVYLIGGIHGDEPEGLRALPAILAALVEPDALRRVRLRVVRDMNPDGTALARRTNARGVDLNRNWNARNFRPARAHGRGPLSEPEAAAVQADLDAFEPDLVIVLHSSRSGPFVNFDGPGGDRAAAFADAAGPPWRVVPSMGYPTPGSLGSLVGVDRGIPILTIEFARGATDPSAAAAGLRAAILTP